MTDETISGAVADKPKVPFPAREDDGCTHCGAILVVTNKDGSFNASGSEDAQRAHMNNTGCVATPNFAATEREIDAKTGRLAGEYDRIKAGR